MGISYRVPARHLVATVTGTCRHEVPGWLATGAHAVVASQAGIGRCTVVTELRWCPRRGAVAGIA